MSSLRRLAVIALAAAAIFAEACITFPVHDAADGAACSKDDECKSRGCFEGYCRGSSCETNDPSTCAAGWKCIHSPADPITAFFGATGSTTCQPLCGSCPGNMYCEKEDQARPDALCRVGKAPLDVSIPRVSGVIGQPIVITAVVAPPAGTITGCTWRISDGSSEQPGGLSITHVFKQNSGDYSVSVTCKDDTGRSGSVDGIVTLSCQPFGGACEPTLCCTDEMGRQSGGPSSPQCYVGDSPTGHVCRVPKKPTVAVTGPATVTVDTDAKFTATVTGDAPLSSVQWTFTGDDFGGGSAATTTHRFRTTGSFVVSATVTDGLGQSGDGALNVTVLAK